MGEFFASLGVPERETMTFGDLMKRLDSNDKVGRIIELLAQRNPILDDVLWREGNLITGHRTTIRTDLPNVSWRRLNEGAIVSKSGSQQFDEPCGTMESWSEIDEEILKLNGNNESVVFSENLAFIEKLNQEMAATVFYGNKFTEPDKFYGIAPRYDVIEADSTGAVNENNRVIDGGNKDPLKPNTSVYLVRWGENTVHGIFPKGTRAGLEINVIGKETLQDGNRRMVVHRTQYTWKCGLAVKDWRYITRVANINPLDMSDAALKAIANNLALAYEMIPDFDGGNTVFYCNRSLRKLINIAAMERKNGFYMVDDIFGRPQPSFWGVPLKRCDQIVNAESIVPVVRS